MSFRYNHFQIERFDANADGSMRVEAIARCPGVLAYRNADGSVRRELVSPEFLRSFDSDGMPLAAKVAGIPVTNDHPRTLIRGDAALKKEVAVGQVGESVRVYKDGRVKVFFDVSDPKTQDDIRSGRKDGVSLGYEVHTRNEGGLYQGMRYDAQQTAPFEADHLAVCQYPRAGGARITRFDADDVAWQDSTDSEQLKMAQLRLDSGATFDVPDAVAQYFDTLRQDMKAKDKKIAEMEVELGERDDAILEALGRLDSTDDHSDAITAEVANRFDAALDVLSIAVPGIRAALDAKGIKLDASMSGTDMRKAVLLAARPDLKLDGLSDEVIHGMALMLKTDGLPKDTPRTDAVTELTRALTAGVVSGNGRTDAATLRQQRMDEDYKRSRAPISA